MFGQSVWFQMSSAGMRLRPRTWQGWAWLAIWVSVISIPYLLLVTRHLAPEAFVWLSASLATWAWDVRCLRRDSRQPLDVREILVIDDHGMRIERSC